MGGQGSAGLREGEEVKEIDMTKKEAIEKLTLMGKGNPKSNLIKNAKRFVRAVRVRPNAIWFVGNHDAGLDRRLIYIAYGTTNAKANVIVSSYGLSVDSSFTSLWTGKVIKAPPVKMLNELFA